MDDSFWKEIEQKKRVKIIKRKEWYRGYREKKSQDPEFKKKRSEYSMAWQKRKRAENPEEFDRKRRESVKRSVLKKYGREHAFVKNKKPLTAAQEELLKEIQDAQKRKNEGGNRDPQESNQADQEGLGWLPDGGDEGLVS